MAANDLANRPWAAGNEPFLEYFRKVLREEGKPGQAYTIRLEREQLIIKPFEQRLLLEGAEPGMTVSLANTLMLDSLACQLKLLTAVRNLSRDEGAEKEQQLVLLRTYYELSCQLAQTLTTEMHVLRENGQIGDANRLSDNRSRLEEVLLIADSTLRAATPTTEKQDDGSQRPVYDWDQLVDPEEVKKKAKETAKKRQTEKLRTLRAESLAKARIAAVLVPISVICIAVSFYLSTRTPNLEPFSVSNFSDWYGIEEVINRPPQLIVLVSQSRWDQLANPKRQEAFDEILKLAQPAGYTQVEIRSRTKYQLVKWKKGEEVEFFQ